MKDYVAFFDMDHTILTTYAGRLYFKNFYNNGYINRWEILKLVPYPFLYKLGLINMEKITRKVSKKYKGMKKKEIFEFAEETYQKLVKSYIRQSMLDEIEFHKKNNGNLVIISASPRNLCQPIKDNLGFDDLICTELEFKDDIFTGNLGVYCYEENKVTLAEEYCKKNGYTLETAYFYSDSITDMPLLEKVKYPVCVGPDRKLKKMALKRNWKVLDGDKK